MYVYTVAAGADETTNATPSTLDAYLALRVAAAKNCALQSFYSIGKGAGLTALSGIAHRLRRWTTVGTGGSSIVPSPAREDMPAASFAAVNGAYTEGTISGAIQLAIGHGATGPGAWVARNSESMKVMTGGSGDEFSFNSISGTASLNFEPSMECVE